MEQQLLQRQEEREKAVSPQPAVIHPPPSATAVQQVEPKRTEPRTLKRENEHVWSDGNSDRSRSRSTTPEEAKRPKVDQESEQDIVKVDPEAPSIAQNNFAQILWQQRAAIAAQLAAAAQSQGANNPLMTLANNAMQRMEAAQAPSTSPPALPSPPNSTSVSPNVADPNTIVEYSKVTDESNARFMEYRASVMTHMDAAGKPKGRRRASHDADTSEEDRHLATGSPLLSRDGKDAAYWERRRKNNEAAKRSRDARRAKEHEVAIRCQYLEQECARLRLELAQERSRRIQQ